MDVLVVQVGYLVSRLSSYLDCWKRFLKEFFCGVSLKHDSKIKIHRSVEIRMKKMKYVPKAKVEWDKAKIEWVD